MRLLRHCYKPRPRFAGEGSYHIGVELEVEAPDRATRRAVLKMKRQGFVYAKRDGSLCERGGIEFVTHPIGVEEWFRPLGKKPNPVHNFLAFIEQIRREHKVTSYSSGACGLHVHFSRKALRDRVHLYWLGRLINGDFFWTLGQRGVQWHDYCQRANMTVRMARYPFSFIPGLRWHDTECNHYYAFNMENRDTIEVRLFRGNMRECRIRKAVESVVCAIEFTRGLTSREWKYHDKPLLFEVAFRAYARAHATRYPNLVAFLANMKETEPACV